MAEMAQPALDWPERAQKALDELAAVATEYDRLGGPMERLAIEAGRQLRYPPNPLDARAIQRMAAGAAEPAFLSREGMPVRALRP